MKKVWMKLFDKGHNLLLHDFWENNMAEFFWESFKYPKSKEATGNIKIAVMKKEKVINQIIDKVGYHGEIARI